MQRAHSACGLSAIESTVLQAIAESKAPFAPRVASDILDHVRLVSGIPPKYALPIILDGGNPDLVHVRFYHLTGSWMPLTGVADPDYFEVGLTQLGASVALADRYGNSRLPVGFINGDLYSMGMSAPFDPIRVIKVTGLLRSSTVDMSSLEETLGKPTFPNGCDAIGDWQELFQTGTTEVVVRARWVILRTFRAELRIVVPTYGDSMTGLLQKLQNHLGVPPGHVALRHDERGIEYIRLLPAPGEVITTFAQKIMSEWPLSRRYFIRMDGSPLERLRQWTHAGPVIPETKFRELLEADRAQGDRSL